MSELSLSTVMPPNYCYTKYLSGSEIRKEKKRKADEKGKKEKSKRNHMSKTNSKTTRSLDAQNKPKNNQKRNDDKNMNKKISNKTKQRNMKNSKTLKKKNKLATTNDVKYVPSTRTSALSFVTSYTTDSPTTKKSISDNSMDSLPTTVYYNPQNDSVSSSTSKTSVKRNNRHRNTRKKSKDKKITTLSKLKALETTTGFITSTSSPRITASTNAENVDPSLMSSTASTESDLSTYPDDFSSTKNIKTSSYTKLVTSVMSKTPHQNIKRRKPEKSTFRDAGDVKKGKKHKDRKNMKDKDKLKKSVLDSKMSPTTKNTAIIAGLSTSKPKLTTKTLHDSSSDSSYVMPFHKENTPNPTTEYNSYITAEEILETTKRPRLLETASKKKRKNFRTPSSRKKSNHSKFNNPTQQKYSDYRKSSNMNEDESGTSETVTDTDKLTSLTPSDVQEIDTTTTITDTVKKGHPSKISTKKPRKDFSRSRKLQHSNDNKKVQKSSKENNETADRNTESKYSKMESEVITTNDGKEFSSSSTTYGSTTSATSAECTTLEAESASPRSKKVAKHSKNNLNKRFKNKQSKDKEMQPSVYTLQTSSISPNPTTTSSEETFNDVTTTEDSTKNSVGKNPKRKMEETSSNRNTKRISRNTTAKKPSSKSSNESKSAEKSITPDKFFANDKEMHAEKNNRTGENRNNESQEQPNVYQKSHKHFILVASKQPDALEKAEINRKVLTDKREFYVHDNEEKENYASKKQKRPRQHRKIHTLKSSKQQESLEDAMNARKVLTQENGMNRDSSNRRRKEHKANVQMKPKTSQKNNDEYILVSSNKPESLEIAEIEGKLLTEEEEIYVYDIEGKKNSPKKPKLFHNKHPTTNRKINNLNTTNMKTRSYDSKSKKKKSKPKKDKTSLDGKRVLRDDDVTSDVNRKPPPSESVYPTSTANRKKKAENPPREFHKKKKSLKFNHKSDESNGSQDKNRGRIPSKSLTLIFYILLRPNENDN